MKILYVFALAVLAITSSACAAPDSWPIPYLSWQDVRALYPPNRYPGDWDCPKLKSCPHEQELIKRCEQDLQLSLDRNPDPFSRGHKLGQGKLHLDCITKDPANRIVYFVFSYRSEMVTDLFVVYYYDPGQGRFILKSTR